MKMESIDSRKVRILGALLFATLVTGCFGRGWGGGSPGYYPSYGTGYYPNNYYSTNVYRGYGQYPQPGLYGGYPPAREAWAASTRGRTSYGGARATSGGHGRGGSGEHSGGTGGGGEHGGSKSHGH